MTDQSVVGKYKMDPQTRKRLWNYFEARRDPLWHVFVDCKDAIDKQKDELVQLASEISDSDWNKRSCHYLRVDNAFLYGQLIVACSIFEDSVRSICIAIDLQYDGREVEKKYKGNWLNKHLQYIKDNNLMPLDSTVFEIENELNHAITLRNCVVHAWGNIDEHRYPDQARDSIKYLQSNDTNCDYASESGDGYLVVGDDLIQHVFDQGEKLIRLLLKID